MNQTESRTHTQHFGVDMPLDIYLRTIPHTGTRFVCSYLDYLGVKYQQWHIGWPEPPLYVDFDDKRVALDVIPRVEGITRYIVTARHPHDTWESLKFDPRDWSDKCLEWHNELAELCESKELVFVFPLDATDRRQALTDLAGFCGVEYDGNFTWDVVKPSGCQHEGCPEDVQKQLGGAYQWYKDHTLEVAA